MKHTLLAYVFWAQQFPNFCSEPSLLLNYALCHPTGFAHIEMARVRTMRALCSPIVCRLVDKLVIVGLALDGVNNRNRQSLHFGL